MPDVPGTPGVSGAAAPVPAEAPSLLRAALDLSGRLLTLEAAALRVRRRGDDEAVHDARVSARRLTSAIALWGPVLAPRPARRTRRRLRRLRRRLTPSRDLEVMSVVLREHLLRVPAAARVVLEGRLAKLERRRDRALGAAATIVTRERIARIRRGLLRAVRRATPAPTSPLPQDLARAAVRSTRDRALPALVEAWTRRDDVSLHRARIRVKAWRYAREIAAETGADVAGPGAPEIPRLRALQQALGRVQDLVVTLRELDRLLRRARAKRLPAHVDALQGVIDALREEKAAAIAEAQRRSTILSVAAVRGRAEEA